MRRGLVVLSCALLLASCGGGGVQRRVTAVDAVREALDAGEGRVALRYNPAQCACAAFEVRTATGWVRAELAESDDEGARDALLARAETDAAGSAVVEYDVRAALASSDPTYCPNRVPCVLLRLLGGEE